MNINIKRGGDDLLKNRLFSYLSKELAVNIHELKQLRGNVYFVRTENDHFILKGYKELRKLKVQEAFTLSLRKSGFGHSYCFYTKNNQPLYFQNEYYGCMEYIQPNQIPFHYGHDKDRQAGIDLLKNFHDKTRDLASSYTTLLPKTDLVRKWHQRKMDFRKNLPQINYHVNKKMTNEFLSWADFSMHGFIKLKNNLVEDQPAILHGDVAHHNFLRSREEKLYLIDYDLISIGSTACDMLQYANRILPFLDWKLSALAELNHLNNWLNNEAFLYGLLYPADLLREWNRLIRDDEHSNPYRTAPIIDMTFSQFQQRRQFQEEIKSLLK